LESPKRGPQATGNNGKTRNRGDDQEALGKISRKVGWDRKEGRSKKGKDGTDKGNKESLGGEDDGARKKKATIAAAIYFIFAICNESAYGGGDADIEEHQVACDLLRQCPKAELFLAKIVERKGNRNGGVSDVDGYNHIARTKSMDKVTRSAGHR